jgi:glutathione S-transferase
VQAAIEKFFAECRMLSRAMAPPSAGPYFLGAQFSLVDVALAPFWQRFELVGGHYRGLQFPDDSDFHRLQVRRVGGPTHRGVTGSVVERA